MYTLNTGPFNFVKQLLLILNSQINSKTVMLDNILLLPFDRLYKKKIVDKQTLELVHRSNGPSRHLKSIPPTQEK